MLKTINVTEDDIKHGRPCDAENCAVARAIERCVQEDVEVIVGPTFIRFNQGFVRKGEDLLVETPKVAEDFIIKFDNLFSSPLKPITFTLEIPEQLLKANYK